MSSISENERRTASISRTVTDNDTAAAWGDTFPPAASTPFVLGLAEITCHQAVEDLLDDDELTVGTSATIRHRAASPVGTTLTATAVLVSRDRSRLTFTVEVQDSQGRTVATVEHRRAIVDRDRVTTMLAQG